MREFFADRASRRPGFFLRHIALVGLWCAAVTGWGGAAEKKSPDAQYQLFTRDLVRVSVHGEPDVSVERRVDGSGDVNLPLLGALHVEGLTVAEAQALIARRYVDEEIFIEPEVVVTVVEYSPKEIMVLGQVGRQGKQLFPPEVSTMSIVEAITSAGGLTRIAKGDAVRVTRKRDGGAEESFSVDVAKMIEGRGAAVEPFFLLPGDVVFVPERVF